MAFWFLKLPIFREGKGSYGQLSGVKIGSKYDKPPIPTLSVEKESKEPGIEGNSGTIGDSGR